MFEVKDGKLTLDQRSQHILAEQTIPPRYGTSPAMDVLGTGSITEIPLEGLTYHWRFATAAECLARWGDPKRTRD